MANYFVIGGDHKEYGPVTDTDVQQWLAEGRLNSESQIKAESDAEFRRLALFPEFATFLAPAATGPLPPQTAKDFLARDYEIDIGDCISRGFNVYKENFGVLFGATLVALIIQMACGAIFNLPASRFILSAPLAVQLGYSGVYSLVLALVNGPMIGGLFLVYLKTIRSQGTGLGEVFAGFLRAFLQLFLGTVMTSLITFACMLPFNFVWQSRVNPLLLKMQQMQTDPAGIHEIMPQLMSGTLHSLPVLLICMIPATFFTVSFQFTLPLIIDKGMSFGEAMKTSWHLVLRHWWQLFGLTVVAGLVAALGLLGCCIGLVFTIPIAVAAMMFAYETIFGTKKN